MPCTYTGSIEGDRRMAEEEDRQKLGKIITSLTQMICGIMDYIENKGLVTDVSELYEVDGLEQFWEKHKKLDAERKERDKKIALSKLTDYDLKLLGLKRPK